MTYQKQIKHPKWQMKRLEILERDSFTCQGCVSKDKELHVHHLTYSKNCLIWEYDNNNLISFCSDCHKDWHKMKDDIISIISHPNLYRIYQIQTLLNIIKDLDRANLDNVIAIINKETK